MTQSITRTDADLQDAVDRGLEHLWVHTAQYNDLAAEDGMMIIESGEGIYLTDAKGRKFIDAMSGLWVVNTGHGRSELADVAREQMARLGYTNTFAYATRPAIDLATKLAEITPPSIQRMFFVNSGSEAVETAIRMAKQYQYNRGEKKRYKVISRVESYHGVTAGAMSVNYSSYINRVPFEPLMPGSIAVPGVNCARCPYEKTYPECDVFCARAVEDVIKSQAPETIAAFIAEPISTANGCWVPAPEYWQTLRDLCDKYGIVLIADEVIDGFGRTGKWFGIDHFPIEPDIMTIAKGLSSGYQPIAAAMASKKIADGFVGDKSDALIGGITFGSHPVACAVALANVKIIEREHLVENSAKVGEHIAAQLRELKSRHRIIADTRGIGLMQLIELKRNPETGEAFTKEDDIDTRMTALLKEQGVLARAGATIPIAPPLVINAEEADELIDIMDRAIGNLERDLGLA